MNDIRDASGAICQWDVLIICLIELLSYILSRLSKYCTVLYSDATRVGFTPPIWSMMRDAWVGARRWATKRCSDDERASERAIRAGLLREGHLIVMPLRLLLLLVPTISC